MNQLTVCATAVCLLVAAVANAAEDQAVLVWNLPAPDDCPFPPSRELPGMNFTDRHAEYTNADTWYPSWASDGNLYSPYTDGVGGE